MKLEKKFDFGKIAFYGRRRINKVTVTVRLEDEGKGPVFSACADVWNIRCTDIVCGGQILGELDKFKYLGGDELFRKIHRLWKKYHCNDMHLGDERQEAYLKSKGVSVCDYEAGRLARKAAGMDKDSDGIEYGCCWHWHPIPEEDLAEIRKLLSE